MSQKMTVNFPNGTNMVIEVGYLPDYPYEVYIGLENQDGSDYQDIAIVRNAYHYNPVGVVVWEKGKLEVLVYGDAESEDYTHRFVIPRTKNERQDDGKIH